MTALQGQIGKVGYSDEESVAGFDRNSAAVDMRVEIVTDSSISEAQQLEVVDKYVGMRMMGDIDGILEIVTEDIVLSSTLSGSLRGKEKFRAYLEKHKTPISRKPAEMIDGIAQCKGKGKILFLSVSFVAKFGIVNTAAGNYIEHIVVGPA